MHENAPQPQPADKAVTPTQKLINSVERVKDSITYELPERERLLKQKKYSEDGNSVDPLFFDEEALPISLSNFTYEGDGFRYLKLKIRKDWLAPEHQALVNHVHGLPTQATLGQIYDHIDIRFDLIDQLNEPKRSQVFAAIALFEKLTGLSVRFDGTVGKLQP